MEKPHVPKGAGAKTQKKFLVGSAAKFFL